jgi:hypothetical protein
MFEIHKILQFNSSGALILLYFIFSIAGHGGEVCVLHPGIGYKCQFVTLYFFSLSLTMEKTKNVTLQIKALF